MWSTVLLVVCAFAFTESVEVSSPAGGILGSILTTRLGKPIYSFRGIRYAKAPLGDLRFKDPVPIGKFSGTYNATVDGPGCPEAYLSQYYPTSEDCLTLNVYTTRLPSTKSTTKKRPVILYIHEGGFYSVSGRSTWEGPQYFMDQDIVLVTFNYRIGSLGFLSVGKEAPGNMGLKDQVLVLKWVQANIPSFGGDPNSVTLYGCSAGSSSVIFHMVSPMSKGLFHKGILASGSSIGTYRLPKKQIEVAKKQAQIVGCPDNTTKAMMDCLKIAPAEALGNSMPFYAEFGYDPVFIWSAVIEEDYGQERFLTDEPGKLIQNGKFMKIPIVAGITKDELDPMAFSVVNNDTLLQELNNNFEKYAPIAFTYERDTPRSREISRAIRRFYFQDRPVTNALFQSLARAYSDSIVGFPVNQAVEMLSQYSDKPVYYYLFTYQGRYSYYYLPESNNTVPYGVTHQDDTIYVLYISSLFPLFNSSFPEAEMVEKLTLLWSNFAKSGNPNCPNRVLCSSEWPRYTTTTKKYLEIGKTFSVKENLREDRYAFWRKLNPLSSY